MSVCITSPPERTELMLSHESRRSGSRRQVMSLHLACKSTVLKYLLPLTWPQSLRVTTARKRFGESIERQDILEYDAPTTSAAGLD